MIVVAAALKGGVGKTTTAVYLSALASNRRAATLIDADPQASAAEWVEYAEDERFQRLEVVEAPTDRLLTRAINRVPPGEIAIIDPPPGHERLLGKAVERASVVVVPTRIGGVETARADAVFEMVPDGIKAGLVICSARTYTRDYRDAVTGWSEARVPVYGTVPERVAIAAGPERALSEDGLDAYRKVWRRVLAAARS
ncbi:MAG: AAA family ATPase [Propionibacteriales bacterium]|nr:AAA family ATPase [Propionibacteriales bacterium]